MDSEAGLNLHEGEIRGEGFWSLGIIDLVNWSLIGRLIGAKGFG